MHRTFAYARVSTAGQTTENQVREIEAAGFQVDARRVVAETVSGSSAIGVSVEAAPAIDVTEFLWASLALFDDEQPADTTTIFRPAPPALHTVTLARERILRRLNEMPDGAPLDQLPPEDSPDTGDATRRALGRRSGWATTFVAGLELAKQGEVVLGQGGDFEPIHVAPA